MAKPHALARTSPGAPRSSGDVAAFRDLVRERRGGAHAYARLLGFEALEGLELLERVRAGFPVKVLERFQRNVGLSTSELAALVQIKPRTLLRRREERRLSAEESDRLLRASRVFGAALELFDGNVEAVRAWLAQPAPALGGRAPREVAATEVGAREVEDLIGRLEHGVFA